MMDETAVKVVVRIRPQISRDILDLCHVCTRTVPNVPQIWIGNEQSYTFDQVFDMPTQQSEIFESCVKDLVDGCFDGYNATVLAYGQTGSGKTYTMGTGFDHSFHHEERGIIPRAVEHLFKKITEIQEAEKEKGLVPPEFKVNAQFMELYNEEVIDLLDTARDLDNKNKRAHIRIHEDADGKIYTHGVIAQCVTNVQEALQCLKIGSLSRTTASTGMNIQSSRSHAIFTLHIKQQRMVKLGKSMSADTCNSELHEHKESLKEFETLTAKFHFVDLAGSERLKRTGAVGERQKESISINSGLLALGNVISALGDKSRKATHVPYRDSKLTRLLQDSLGGNSRTLMIACISPSDRDFVETLSTLKYANRAKNIKNKVTANKDKSSQTISELLKQVENLQMELLEFKQGKRLVGEDGVECVNDMYHENTMLQSENNSLKTRIKALQETVDRLTAKNTALIVEKQNGEWILNGDGSKSDISAVIQGYVAEIEALRAKLIESEEAYALLRKSVMKVSPQRYAFSPTSTVAVTGQYDIRIDATQSVTEILEEAKRNVKKLKQKEKKLKGEKECVSDEDKDKVDDENNNEDNEDENSSSESETEKPDVKEKLSANLAELTCDISLKEKLIRQLEANQKHLQNMKHHYEGKISQLLTKIAETEKERDKILANLAKNAQGKSEEQKIRADYEKKLSSLKNDVKNFESAKKQHVNYMKTPSNSDARLKRLKQEVIEMKQAKVQLLAKMKEEAKKFRDAEQKKNKEIAQLKREKLNKETQIRNLEAEKKHKDNILKRKTEEILSLRKKAVPKYVSPKTAGRWKQGHFSLKSAKQKWQNLEKKINKLALNKQSVAAIEKDMNRWLKEREKLGRCLDKVTRKHQRALIEQKSPQIIAELEDEIESLKANIEYIHENLHDCQTSIMQIEEAKEDADPADIINTLCNMQLEEAPYLIEKIVNMVINQSFQVAQKEATIKELESELKQVIDNSAVQEQLLFHVFQQNSEHFADLNAGLPAPFEESDNSRSSSSSRSASPVDSITSFFRESTVTSDRSRARKARNVAATTEELLFSPDSRPFDNQYQQSNDIISGTVYTQTAAPAILHEANGDLSNKSLSYVILPASDSDKFDKVSHMCSGDAETMRISIFKPFIGDNEIQSSYLKCSHIAEGHKKAVLTVECTEDVLFSGSEDGSVKIWDLSTGTEIQNLDDHASSVVKVCYCEYTRQAFTASSSMVKVWDVRQKPSSCISVLWSSGQVFSGSTSPALKNEMQDHFWAKEYHINDISLSQYGTLLFCATSRSVQIWDLRKMQWIGALNVGYQANVLCLAVNDVEFEKIRIICGSQDQSIKGFEVKEENDYGVHHSNFNLSPPHYDAVQALAISDNTLFSGSRDMSIKKWDLKHQVVEHSVYQAHKDWVCSLNILQGNDKFVSGCRSGYIKLWSSDKCDMLEEIRAHGSSVNSIASNGSLIFTASSDCTVGVWRMIREKHSGLRVLR